MRLIDRVPPGALPASGPAVPACLLRTTSVAALAFATALAAPGPASANCVLTSGPGTATSPGTGAVVTCNIASPNPFTQRILAQPGSANVRVDVLSGAALQPTPGPAVGVQNLSQVNNAGQITTTRTPTQGSRADAVTALGFGNTLTNTGTIVTNAPSAGPFLLGGAGLFASGSSNRLTNAGTITTTGPDSAGLSVFGGNNSLVNQGAIVTTGGLFSDGIIIQGSSNTALNSGAITVTGASGIQVQGNSNTITNTNTIQSTGGAFGRGVLVSGNNNIVTNAGAIAASGPNATGIIASGNGNFLLNTGTVTANGDQGFGIVASGTSITIRNEGQVVTSGINNSALSFSASFFFFGSELTNSGGATLTNSGRITTTGEISRGLLFTGSSGTARNSGTIETQGSQAHGLQVNGNGNAITNSGTITTSGNEAHAIVVSGSGSTVVNTGVATARGAGSHGVRIEPSNSGLVFDPITGLPLTPSPAQSNILFANLETGTVTSERGLAVLGGAGNDTVQNFGTLATGVADGTAVDLGNGRNTLLLGPTSAITGKVLAGTGIDTFILSGTGTGTFDVSEIGPAAKYQGFDLFQKAGSSKWTLTGSGAQNWTISNGTLEGDTRSLQGNIGNNSILIFNQAFDGTYAGSISGAGFLVKDGPGAVILSGTSSLSGGTIVDVGSLIVNGSLANSSVSVAGLLGGAGTVGSISVLGKELATLTGGGTVSPGHNSIGTLTANGSVSFGQGSTFRVDADPAGQSDRLRAATANLTGGTVQVLAAPGNWGPLTTFTILSTSAGLVPTFPQPQQPTTFAGVTVDLPFLEPSLSYTSTDVLLTLRRIPRFLSARAATPNQIGVAGALDEGPTGNPVFLAAARLTATEARGAFDLLSGEVHASAVTAAVENSRLVRDAVLDRLRGLGTPAAGGQAQSAFASYAADAPGPRQAVAVPVQTVDPRAFTVWGQGFGSWGRTDGDANAASLKRSTGGFILGADATFDERWRAGFAGGYTRTSIDVDARLSSGAIESVHGAVYGGANLGALQLRAGAAIAGQEVTTTRAVAFRGFADGLRAGYGQTVLQAFGEAGYRIALGTATVEPFAQLAALRINGDEFREDGGAAALFGLARTHEVAFSTLGVRAEARLAETPLVARGMFGWRHAFGDTTPAALLAFGGGALPFLVAGAPVARDSLVVEAGLDYRLTPTAAVGVSYAGALAEDARDHMLKARFEVSF